MDDCINYGYFVLTKENIISFAVFIVAYLFTNISQENQKTEKVLICGRTLVQECMK